MSTSPGRPCSFSAIWFAIVAVGTKIAASCPSSRGDALLQLVDARVLALLLVADPRLGDRSAHALRWLRRGVGAEVDHGTARYRPLRGPGPPGADARRARRARVSRPPGVGVDGARRVVLRRHDDAAEGAPRDARRVGALLDPRARHRARVARRDGEGALPVRRDGHPVEAVLMRYRDGRRSLCLSSQSGCPLTCTFCATGAMRFGRNLTASEIVDQALHFRRSEPVNHAVYMGMGEPFLNFDDVLASARRLPDIGITPRRTTISTVGWMPGLTTIRRRGRPADPPRALDPRGRPLEALRADAGERPLPARDVLAECRRYVELRRRKVFVEYVMLAGVNDSPTTRARSPACSTGGPSR